MSTTVVVGGQYGDEGKGKFVHYLVNGKNIAIVGRGNGGPNAGHNVHDPSRGIDVALHLMPSGIFAENVINIVGDGTVVNPHTFVEEMEVVKKAGAKLSPEKLKLSSRAHIILNTHRAIDGATDKVGSTAQGIGPTYRDKAVRSGLRLEIFLRQNWAEEITRLLISHNLELEVIGAKNLELNVENEISALKPIVEIIRPYITDTVLFLSEQVKLGAQILAEGAQATMLDINHGTYPFVTSSSATSGGIVLGLGLPPMSVDKVIGVFKLPMTRVGKGPFTTLLTEAEHDLHQKLAGIKGDAGSEFGATTGRARSIGWMDLVMAKYAHRVNGFTDIGLTKLDMLSGIPKLKVCISYMLNGKEIKDLPADTAEIEKCTSVYTELNGWNEDIAGTTDFAALPKNAQNYVEFIENFLGIKVTMIGTGPNNADMIIR